MRLARTRYLIGLCLALVVTPAAFATSPIQQLITAMSSSSLPRNTKLPLFNPHRKDFTCMYQAQHLPPVDPQAELWFQQALALDDPTIYYKKRDWKKIYELYQQAAERNHWQAMLNLAALILNTDYPVPEHDTEVAIRWVEKAMQLGVPDAWDMMGTYHQHGLVKGGDATSAYAFFQKAADMGSPRAQVFLGEALDAGWDNPGSGFWANQPIGQAMLKCALAQGNGDAADQLSFDYAGTGTAKGGTPEGKRRALEVLHEGVKLGSAKAANDLASEFRGFALSTGRNIVGYADEARADRYSKLGDALEFYEGRLKLPNLDKVLPLPPARLPKWNGNVQTLIDAAKAVTPPIKLAPEQQRPGRAAIPLGYTVPSLSPTARTQAGNEPVAETGYWIALDRNAATAGGYTPAFVRGGYPEYYRVGERFEPPPANWMTAEQVRWHFLGEAYRKPQPQEYLPTLVKAGLIRQLEAEASPPLVCAGTRPCPQTGIWEGRVAADHPLSKLYNHWYRQTFVEQGNAFPDPHGQDLDIAAREVRWTWLGSPNAQRVPGVYDIAL
ncbi:SEL1-like repeat protein [Paraburkholderia adhaesiva]|uniref:SEL1-like repeat protein n=1 Tax=Paraburkholderia adhaesiva TaxID=2883244 RepID=UPI001F3ED4D3|nr:DUF6396 domain-containing protein [Paraburkholderia adhaesiva]